MIPVLIGEVLGAGGGLSTAGLTAFPCSCRFQGDLGGISLSLCACFASISAGTVKVWIQEVGSSGPRPTNGY